MKSLIILGMNLAFGVPLAGALAVVSFIIGFFPIVGSWSVYVPVAIWLVIFRDATGAGDRDGGDRHAGEHGVHLDVPAAEDRGRPLAAC